VFLQNSPIISSLQDLGPLGYDPEVVSCAPLQSSFISTFDAHSCPFLRIRNKRISCRNPVPSWKTFLGLMPTLFRSRTRWLYPLMTRIIMVIMALPSPQASPSDLNSPPLLPPPRNQTGPTPYMNLYGSAAQDVKERTKKDKFP